MPATTEILKEMHGVFEPLHNRNTFGAHYHYETFPICKGAELIMTQILIADDHEATRKLLRGILEAAGYHLTICANGQEVLDKLASPRQSYDLFVLDITMPILDGALLCQAIRQVDMFTDTPILILTALADDASKQKLISAGANAYLVKPVPLHVLRQTVEDLLERSPAASFD